jgi:ligand-binding sensor domain-containing protein/HPt (histidine-containing phosphotransfer) domain-containing protein
MTINNAIFWLKFHSLAKPFNSRSVFSALLSLWLLSWLMASAGVQALPAKINFKRVFDNHDVAIGAVESIVQDQQGYIWIGGENGLLRYDGYDLRVMGQADNNGVPVKNIYYMLVDSRGILWISTSAGLVRYYPQQEQFVRYNNSDGEKMQLSSVNARHLAELPSGELALATIDGLTIINVDTGVTKILRHEPGNSNSLQSNALWAIAVTERGNLWVGTDNGADFIDRSTGEFSHYGPAGNTDSSQIHDEVLSIIEDNAGNIWLGTMSGLSRIAPDGKITQFFHEPNNPNSISSNAVRRLYEDSEGIIWIGTDQGGLNYFNPETHEFGDYKFTGGVTNSLSSNVIRSIFEDRNGDLWIGNFPTGVNYFDRSTAATSVYTSNAADPASLGHNSVLSITPDGTGNFWLGTDGGGLDYFDRKSDTFSHHSYDPNNANSISANAVLTTLLDSEGTLWAGTWGAGFNRYDPQKNQFVRYNDVGGSKPGTTQSKLLNSSNIRIIKEDKLGNFWLGTQNGGLNKYDRRSGMFTHYMPDSSDKTAISFDIIYSLLEDSRGRFWVGTQNSLELMDRQKGTFSHFQNVSGDDSSLSNNSILSSFEDSQGRVWFGTYDGLNQLLPNGKSFRRYGKKDGFYDAVIRSIIEGPDGQLWIGTSNGISAFNPDTGTVKNYYKNNGWLTGDFNIGASHLTDSKELLFGGSNGFTLLNLAALKTNQTIPPIAITDFKLFTTSIKPNNEDQLLPNAIDYTDSITLNYTQSMISFTFSALNFRDPIKNQYAYKLEGFDEDWRFVETQRQATYTNIDPGKYVLRVKGSNNDGIWNEEGTQLTIIQLPPPWRTWWAYTLYGLAGVAVFVWFLQSQRAKRRRVEEQNRLLEIRVAERTVQLQKKNHDIENMLSNMQQGLFTIVENSFIDPEYSAFMETIFETQNIAGRNAAEFLFCNSNLGDDAINQNKATIDSLVGADEMMFEFNKHLLVKEHTVRIGESEKILALDWSPIIFGDEIAKLMVTVRDITALKVLEKDAENQKRELGIVAQLLNVSAKKFQDFEQSSRDFIEVNRQLVNNNQEKSTQVIEQLFRNMHTIKGNSRVYGFNFLTDVVHNAETIYSTLRQSTEATWCAQDLLVDLQSVEDRLNEYAHVYYDVLHRAEKSSGNSRGDGFWLEDKVIDLIRGNFGTKRLENQLARIFDYAQSGSVPEVLESIIKSLDTLATDLKKSPPTVTFSTNSIRVKKEAYELHNNIFMHLLRNSLDHGLEEPQERLLAGKTEQGNIHIRGEILEDSVVLICGDDGRGLNLQKLYQLGLKTNLWQADEKPEPSSIARLILQSGVSTKQQLSDVSGRGVGMDAVATFLKERGGSIELILRDRVELSAAGEYSFVGFDIKIKLPKELYVLDQLDDVILPIRKDRAIAS